MCFGKKGSEHPAYGHKWSDKTRAKIIATLKQQEKTVRQLDRITGILIAEFHNLKEAQATTGIAYHAISGCCNGRRPSAGGFKWKFKEK